MFILFIHQNFPGQFRHLAPAMQAAGHTVRALAVQGKGLQDIEIVRHQPSIAPSKTIHPWLAEFETKLIRGTSALQAMLAMKQQGWNPDLVVTHPAWGEAMFIKEVWPECKVLAFLEFYYSAVGRDVGFEPEMQTLNMDMLARLRLKNMTHMLALECMDHGMAPTHWQRSTFPSVWQDRIDVIFDGIDTTMVQPGTQAQMQLKHADGTGHNLKVGDEVLTFVSRQLEPYRGYHQFMRALPRIQAQRPNAITLIVGGEGQSYGPAAPKGSSWKNIYLDEVKDQLDMSRIYFLGTLAYENYLKVLQLSACHVYLTYPFVLSWSCVEALSAGCLVVGSRTAPVQEVIEDGQNGVLCDFFDVQELADKVSHVLKYPARYKLMRTAARKTAVSRYDLQSQCLPAQQKLLTSMVSRQA
ncbi:glycosyltransferase [Limnohabitans sp.]|jgi:glycosyltransferase involved in cell wall biosynthesis